MRGRLRYCCRIFSILDLVVIIVGFSMLALGRDNESSRSLSATSTLRSIRFLQIARVFRLDRCGTSWKLLRSVFLTHAKELLSAVYLGSLTLVFSSFAIYRLESGINQQNGTDPFGTFGDALWWGVSTFSTIGYGDKVPSTGIAKFISSILSIIGICFFALPAGILGTGFALKVQEQHRVKHNVKRRIPAARLIQTLWKIHAAEQSMLRRCRRSQRGSFRKKKNEIYHDLVHTQPEIQQERSPSAFIQGFAGILSSIKNRQEDECFLSSDSGEYFKNASEGAKIQAVRFITKVKFFVARKQFREALRPYDITDVIEQYSKGYLLVHDSVKAIRAGNDEINLELQALREKMSLMMSKMDRIITDQRTSSVALAQLKIEQNLGNAKSKRIEKAKSSSLEGKSESCPE
ncbi:Oidioi.mRNA.OKI2018_I69.chr1.g654.t1.cds [Oikopleura dioica]|uniref:Oidioi.mRNA.OKI2018_I69.chr1.g654.t1.cds n=1 Tax=Oikopleura dioica TaxID=34765 RepID=A0ABN7SRT2_OIKDI|nr:Oidioi.mRNA.OKI2018_I69.chr1.g654.t1.cds [Oikopleura dioica]